MGGSTSVLCSSPTYWFGATVTSTDDLPDVPIGKTPEAYQPAGSEALFPDGAWIARVDVTPGWTLLVIANSADGATSIVNSVRAAS
jgi:hypothetical protein